MTARFWGRACTAKIAAGIVLAIVTPPLVAAVEVVTRRWPKGGAR